MCSAIEYEYNSEPMVTALCHCTDCQKWSGSAYTSNVVVPRKDFKVIKGSPKDYNIKGDSGKMNDHWFCGGTLCLNSYHAPEQEFTHTLKRMYLFANDSIRPTDCGSSLYTELEVMPDAVCIKAGGIDDKEVRDFKKTSVEFYCKDRMGYSKAVEGAEQKPVSYSSRRGYKE